MCGCTATYVCRNCAKRGKVLPTPRLPSPVLQLMPNCHTFTMVTIGEHDPKRPHVSMAEVDVLAKTREQAEAALWALFDANIWEVDNYQLS